MPQNRRSRRVTFRDPIAAGARMVSKGGKRYDGSAAWHLQQAWESGHSSATQRKPLPTAHHGRRADGRCAKDGGQQCEQSANSLQLLERPLHGESKFVRQSA